MSWKVDIALNGRVIASVYSPDVDTAAREMMHYANQYKDDGEIMVYWKQESTGKDGAFVLVEKQDDK